MPHGAAIRPELTSATSSEVSPIAIVDARTPRRDWSDFRRIAAWSEVWVAGDPTAEAVQTVGARDDVNCVLIRAVSPAPGAVPADGIFFAKVDEGSFQINWKAPTGTTLSNGRPRSRGATAK